MCLENFATLCAQRATSRVTSIERLLNAANKPCELQWLTPMQIRPSARRVCAQAARRTRQKSVNEHLIWVEQSAARELGGEAAGAVVVCR